MDWQASTLWWLATGVLVAVELATGTFYLLMLAVGTAAAAVAAHVGLGTTAQLVAAAVTGGGAVALWHFKRAAAGANASTNPGLNLDVGSTVHVTAWRPDGTARVHYRGSDWDARHAGPGTPQPGPHVIHAMEGTRLVLTQVSG